MSKKVVSILLAAALGAGMMTCAVPVFAEEELSGDLLIWTSGDPERLAIEQMIPKYEETHPNVNVEIVTADNLEVTITACAASGDYSAAPDIIEFQDYSYTKFVENYPDLFQPLDDYGFDWENLTTSKVDSATVGGARYGIPYDNGVGCAGWRVDVLEEAGYTIEDLTDITWDRFIEIGKDVKAKTGYPMFASVAGEAQILCMMLTSAGTAFFNEEGMPELAENPAMVEAMEVYTELVAEGIVVEVTDWTQFNSVTANNVTIGFINGCWHMPNIEQAADQAGKWAITNVPRLDVEGGTNYTCNGGSSFSVLKKANAELAVDFMKWLFTNPETAEEFYTVSLENGRVGSYLPAAEIPAYQNENEFWSGQKVYDILTGEFANQVPSVQLGAYYYDGVRAVSSASSSVLQNGTDIVEELKAAEETLAFNMGF